MAVEVEPAGHGEHGSDDAVAAENVPGPQGVQVGEPAVSAVVPGPHAWQLSADEAPGNVDAVPAGHAMQAVEEVAKGAMARPRKA